MFSFVSVTFTIISCVRSMCMYTKCYTRNETDDDFYVFFSLSLFTSCSIFLSVLFRLIHLRNRFSDVIIDICCRLRLVFASVVWVGWYAFAVDLIFGSKSNFMFHLSIWYLICFNKVTTLNVIHLCGDFGFLSFS